MPERSNAHAIFLFLTVEPSYPSLRGLIIVYLWDMNERWPNVIMTTFIVHGSIDRSTTTTNDLNILIFLPTFLLLSSIIIRNTKYEMNDEREIGLESIKMRKGKKNEEEEEQQQQ